MTLYEKTVTTTTQYDLVGALALAPTNGLILEFGVFTGGTLAVLGRTAPTRIVYGFDWWQGIPEDLCGKRGIDGEVFVHDPKGSFKGKPEDGSLPQNCVLVDGLFDDSLPAFLELHTDPVAFVHIDCDLYSSTKTVLTLLKDRLLDGAVLAFDELIYTADVWEHHEFKAFEEFLADTGYEYECISYSGPRAAFVIRRK